MTPTRNNQVAIEVQYALIYEFMPDAIFINIASIIKSWGQIPDSMGHVCMGPPGNWEGKENYFGYDMPL